VCLLVCLKFFHTIGQEREKEREKEHLACKNLCQLSVKVLCWKKRTWEEVDNAGSPRKWPLKWCDELGVTKSIKPVKMTDITISESIS